MNIFEFLDYKKYLKARLSKGEKANFANFIGCAPSYLSQVISGKPEISMEHGMRANRYFDHSEVQSKFFLLLLQFSKAGSQELKDFLHKQIREMQALSREVKEQISGAEELGPEEKSIYYSSWVYPALHILLALPEARDTRAIAKKLDITTSEAENRIAELLQLGIVAKTKHGFEVNAKRLHLTPDSPLLMQYHSQSRIKALELITKNKKGNLHYSSYISMTQEDAEKIRNLILSNIKEVESIYRPSEPKTVYGFNLDYFELK